jgi:hypothetical protein
MKNFILTLVVTLSYITFFAQNPGGQRPIFQVEGKVVEVGTNQALEYATLIFTPQRGSVTGGITDENGYFKLDIPAGMYDISVEFLSFKTKSLGSRKITSHINLGTITMEPDVEALDEVEIIAEKTTVEVKLDKKIYNVGQDMTVKGGNASEVLENVPSVTVDVEGNVSLRGSESVRILIDGKPSGLVGINATDALKQLPSDAIQKVEVITSPSARYDAEGTAGIINIILRKGKANGFNASISANVGIPENYGLSSNVNYRGTKFNVFSNLGFNYRNAPGEAYFFNYIDTESNKTREENREYNRMRNGFNGNVGLEYFLTEKSSVTGSFLYRAAPGDTDVTTQSINHIDNTEGLRTEMETETDHVVEYAFNFTQKFKSDDHKWTIDVKYEESEEDETSDITDTETIPTYVLNSTEKLNNLENQNQWLIKSDYVLPLGEKHQFEAGFQADLKNNTMDYTLMVDEVDDLGDFTTFNTMDYQQNIYAGYVQYGSKLGKFSYLAGLRLEHTQLDVLVDGEDSVEDFSNLDLDFTRNYSKLFPTLNLSYEMSETENVTLGYNRRIRRPWSRHLNPFPSRASAYNIFKGNPALEAVISDAFDLGYYKRWKKFSINGSVYFQHAEDALQFVRYSEGADDEIVYASPINLAEEDRIGAELSLTLNPSRGVRVNNSFNIFNYKSDGTFNGEDYIADDVSWFNRFSAKVGLTKKSDFQLNFMYMGPTENSNMLRKGMFSANAAYSIDILKDKGTFSINVSDIFNTRHREMYSYLANHNSYVKFQWRKRQIMFNFTYRFNQKKKMQRPERMNGGGDEMM